MRKIPNILSKSKIQFLERYFLWIFLLLKTLSREEFLMYFFSTFCFFFIIFFQWNLLLKQLKNIYAKIIHFSPEKWKYHNICDYLVKIQLTLTLYTKSWFWAILCMTKKIKRAWLQNRTRWRDKFGIISCTTFERKKSLNVATVPYSYCVADILREMSRGWDSTHSPLRVTVQ